MTLTGFLTVVFLGLVLGSFATALTWRVPRGISWIRKQDGAAARSACPSCDAALRFPDLVPVFSWLFLKGRCRHCGRTIPARYPLIELMTLAGCLGIYFAWGFSAFSVLLMLTMPFLAALLAIDLEHMILPDQLNLAVFILGLCAVIYEEWGGAFDYRFIVEKLAAAVLYAGLIWLAGAAVSFFLKKEALGFGDVKFFAAAGIWLGLMYLPVFLILSGIFGVVCGLIWKLVLKKEPFPFGPALILAFYACLILQGTGFLSFFKI